MAQLIATQQVLENQWTEQPLEEDGNAGPFVAPSTPTLYPLAFWRAHREAIIASAQAGALPLGLLLQPYLQRPCVVSGGRNLPCGIPDAGYAQRVPDA